MFQIYYNKKMKIQSYSYYNRKTRSKAK